MIGEFKGYKGFNGSIEEDNGCYFGSLLGIHDLVAYEGETLDDLYQDYKDAIDDYLEVIDELDTYKK